jgi:hypothetical protein
MNVNRKVCTAAAGLLAACITAATASAQNFMEYQYGASAGAVSQVSVANLKQNWVATGVRNGEGDIELITWKSTGHALERAGSATGPAISNASLGTVALTPHLVVTAVPTAGGGGELISWSISASGAVTLGNTAPLPGQWLSVAKLDSRNVLVGFQDPEGTVGTFLYTVTATAIAYENEVFNTEGTITSVAAINSGEFVTAIRTNAGTLQLDSWAVSLGAVYHQATATAGAISAVSLTADDEGGVATAVRNSAGDLEVIDWAVDPSSGAIARMSSATVGAASQVAASTIGELIFTASVNSSGKVDAGVWGLNGSQLTAGDTAQAEAATLVAAAPLSTGLETVTATRTAAGNLQVDVWSGDYVAP